jgi:hypothetical protein
MGLIDPRLPQLVARTFAYDLQRMTLKDIQPQIVNGLDGFLEELRQDDIHASRIDSLQLDEIHAARINGKPRVI